ncbi:hypothetical protein CcaverHIS002_0701610 [Cutaneotrichosporon cavernicola]|uniref:Amine oxidase domain-containing protein n=1 Tax=Cutaneotrichosporon cavernicola TaxID=279322 RepID=A0AA48QYJ2_9TREE|nr:uncharacterized protein CcaverHIS019_0701640 [Cutaneotrichosporon cavernicola]BEI86815.1 hypothetical protein CcaverHIS002_0701610 [Cutaneotrichosporon cavernicola]BEI94592.1 hypothetical protein CcaverHIS019_0701640 [Cutaneotrichosporon cavernicola]BEJ02369.1 hypothetical protein CcaverHIS631_0701640 [Cutaneotrichosporon cavernicola]BEJ10126.1 hypothetical protein CcaverHIS641_0701610 [Cutaneotrichosporon cavernicola]
MRVAIVGSGISGLSALWFLKKHSDHEVNIYESAEHVGGQARGIIYRREGKEDVLVDTGLMAFSPAGSPTLAAFLKHLDLPTRRTDMSLAVSRQPRPAGVLNLFNPRAWRLAFDTLRFRYAQADDDQKLGAWLSANGYSAAFFDEWLLPRIARLWLLTDDLAAKSMPAGDVVRGVQDHEASWEAITGGGAALIDKLASVVPPENLHTRAEIVSITSHEYGVRLVEAGGTNHIYDHVILAIPGNRALKLLKAGSWAAPEEEEALSGDWTGIDAVPATGAVPTAVSVTSTPAPPAYDASMPAPTQTLALTYDMGRIAAQPGITLHIAPGSAFQVPLPSTRDLAPAQNTRRIAYAGAWARGGRAEDALVSALELVKSAPFNASPPLEGRRRAGMAMTLTLARIVLAYAEGVRSITAPLWTVVSWPVALALAIIETATPVPRARRQIALLRKCWE